MAEPPLTCVVEIPRGSRNKYEYDEELGGIKLDRFLSSSVVYPADYGFIPRTLGEDGDPLDALVFVSEPTFPGCIIPVKPLGLFCMRDEKGEDEKVVCVPLDDPGWSDHESLADVPEQLRNEISQFFDIYKDLEVGKETTIEGWRSREDAERIIAHARERYGDPPSG